MDSGVIVRDISKDGEQDFHIKALRLTMDLKTAYELVKK